MVKVRGLESCIVGSCGSIATGFPLNPGKYDFVPTTANLLESLIN